MPFQPMSTARVRAARLGGASTLDTFARSISRHGRLETIRAIPCSKAQRSQSRVDAAGVRSTDPMYSTTAEGSSKRLQAITATVNTRREHRIWDVKRRDDLDTRRNRGCPGGHIYGLVSLGRTQMADPCLSTVPQLRTGWPAERGGYRCAGVRGVPRSPPHSPRSAASLAVVVAWFSCGFGTI